jgi:hypothetical protein
MSRTVHPSFTCTSRLFDKVGGNHPQGLVRHALAHLIVHPSPSSPLLRPAGSQWPLPGLQAMQPSADGRWLGRNRGNPPELAAPAPARQRPRHPAPTPLTFAATVDHLTRRLIKVIKHDQFPTFLRYNLPPIIRTSPDRASQHRQCPGIDTPHRPQRAAHPDRVKLARLLLLKQNLHFSRICRAVITLGH